MLGQGNGELDGELIVFVHPLLLDFQGGAMWRVGAMSKKAGKNSDMPPPSDVTNFCLYLSTMTRIAIFKTGKRAPEIGAAAARRIVDSCDPGAREAPVIERHPLACLAERRLTLTGICRWL